MKGSLQQNRETSQKEQKNKGIKKAVRKVKSK